MKIIFQLQKNRNPKTYSQFTLIELKFINTFQVWSVNLTIFNIFLQLLNEKKQPTRISSLAECC